MANKVQLIKEEIKRRIEQCYRLLKQDLLERERNETSLCLQQYKELLQFIDSLPKEPANEDLEEAAKHYLYSEILDCIRCFKAGIEWKKQQMMKNTVDAIVHVTSHSKYFIQDTNALSNALANYNAGDKVKIIIVKEEQQ